MLNNKSYFCLFLLLTCSIIILLFTSNVIALNQDKQKEVKLSEITFYADYDYPPFNYLLKDKRQNKPGLNNAKGHGFAVAILKKIFDLAYTNTKPKIKYLKWSEAYMMTLLSSKPAGIFVIVEMPERKESFHFSTKIMTSENGIFCKKSTVDDQIKTAQELGQQQYALEAKDLNKILLKKHNVAETHLHEYKTITKAIQIARKDNDINCVAYSVKPMKYILSRDKKVDKLQYMGYSLSAEPITFGFNKKTPDHIIQKFQKLLKKVLK
jgi:hypothetical protein